MAFEVCCMDYSRVWSPSANTHVLQSMRFTLTVPSVEIDRSAAVQATLYAQTVNNCSLPVAARS
jgi:hypothetical protein